MDSKKKKTKECPSCAMMIDAKADICPICGYEFPKNNFISTITVIILLITVVLYLIF